MAKHVFAAHQFSWDRVIAIMLTTTTSPPSSPPKKSSQRRYQATTALVLRSGPSLVSERCGVLEKATRVIALQEEVVMGVCRMSVASELDTIQSLGWVTASRGGIELLMALSANESPSGFYSSVIAYSSPRKSPLR